MTTRYLSDTVLDGLARFPEAARLAPELAALTGLAGCGCGGRRKAAYQAAAAAVLALPESSLAAIKGLLGADRLAAAVAGPGGAPVETAR